MDTISGWGLNLSNTLSHHTLVPSNNSRNTSLPFAFFEVLGGIFKIHEAGVQGLGLGFEVEVWDIGFRDEGLTLVCVRAVRVSCSLF